MTSGGTSGGVSGVTSSVGNYVGWPGVKTVSKQPPVIGNNVYAPIKDSKGLLATTGSVPT